MLSGVKLFKVFDDFTVVLLNGRVDDRNTIRCRYCICFRWECVGDLVIIKDNYLEIIIRFRTNALLRNDLRLVDARVAAIDKIVAFYGRLWLYTLLINRIGVGGGKRCVPEIDILGPISDHLRRLSSIHRVAGFPAYL